jgi:hypothetical protein
MINMSYNTKISNPVLRHSFDFTGELKGMKGRGITFDIYS